MCPCAGEALGKSSLLPVPYDAILKEPGCVVAHGLPDGVGLKKPCEYDTKTLMKILEQSHRIQFSVSRRVCGTNAETGSRSSSSSVCIYFLLTGQPKICLETPRPAPMSVTTLPP